MDPIQPEVAQAQQKKNIGPLIAGVIILVLLVIAALYVWGEKLSTRTMEETQATTPTETTVAADQNPAISNSDEVDTLQAELDANETIEVDLSELDSI